VLEELDCEPAAARFAPAAEADRVSPSDIRDRQRNGVVGCGATVRIDVYWDDLAVFSRSTCNEHVVDVGVAGLAAKRAQQNAINVDVQERSGHFNSSCHVPPAHAGGVDEEPRGSRELRCQR